MSPCAELAVEARGLADAITVADALSALRRGLRAGIRAVPARSAN